MRIPKPKGNGPFRFGKRPVKPDVRNIPFKAVRRAPPKLPAEYDFDVEHSGVPTPMFANDDYGNCVIAGRAHQTLRFELVEQRKLIKIHDEDVLREYFDQTDGVDSGLIVLDSLKDWRVDGWKIGQRRYKIQAFAQIDPTSRQEVKQALYAEMGVGLGFVLPNAAMTQFYAGKPWEIVSGKNGKPNPRNGHYVYASGYTRKGPVCITWGRKQQLTWGFLAKYCDEAYVTIDAVNTKKKKRAINTKKLESMLSAAEAARPGQALRV